MIFLADTSYFISSLRALPHSKDLHPQTGEILELVARLICPATGLCPFLGCIRKMLFHPTVFEWVLTTSPVDLRPIRNLTADWEYSKSISIIGFSQVGVSLLTAMSVL